MHKTFVSLLNGSADVARTILLALLPNPPKELTLIDLCSNQASIVGPLEFKDVKYVDVQAQPNLPVHQFVQADVRCDHWVFESHYDVATCMDGIEHLTRADGMRLILRMDEIADTPIIFTPLSGFGIDKNSIDPDHHKSLWQPWDFQGWQKLVFPAWHPALNCGAFFAWSGGHVNAINRLIHGGMRLEPI